MSLFTGEETMAQRDTATKSQSWDSNSGQCLPEAWLLPQPAPPPVAHGHRMERRTQMWGVMEAS